MGSSVDVGQLYAVGLQLLLNLHQRFLHAFAVVSLALFVYKGRVLPYPPTGALTWDVVFLFLYLVIETSRLFQGSKGNTTRQRGPLGLAVALSVPTLVCNIYYLRLQTYVLRVEVALNGLAIAMLCAEVLLFIATLLLLSGRSQHVGMY